MNYRTLFRSTELVCVCVCVSVCVHVCLCVCMFVSLMCLSVCMCMCVCAVYSQHNYLSYSSCLPNHQYYYTIVCDTQGAQGKVKESERLKDDGRLDVSITVCSQQLKVTIGVHQMVEASEIQSRTETVATMLLGEYRG